MPTPPANIAPTTERYPPNCIQVSIRVLREGLSATAVPDLRSDIGQRDFSYLCGASEVGPARVHSEGVVPRQRTGRSVTEFVSQKGRGSGESPAPVREPVVQRVQTQHDGDRRRRHQGGGREQLGGLEAVGQG